MAAALDAITVERARASSATAVTVHWPNLYDQTLYGVKLHFFLCATNWMPLCYEFTHADVAKVSLSEELLAEAKLGEKAARGLLGDLAYRS